MQLFYNYYYGIDALSACNAYTCHRSIKINCLIKSVSVNQNDLYDVVILENH